MKHLYPWLALALIALLVACGVPGTAQEQISSTAIVARQNAAATSQTQGNEAVKNADAFESRAQGYERDATVQAIQRDAEAGEHSLIMAELMRQASANLYQFATVLSVRAATMVPPATPTAEPTPDRPTQIVTPTSEDPRPTPVSGLPTFSP